MKRSKSKISHTSQRSATAAATRLGTVLYDTVILRNLLNVLADGDGLASNERISALALASLKFLDDIEEAVNAALCQSAEPDPNASSVTNYVLCDCVD